MFGESERDYCGKSAASHVSQSAVWLPVSDWITAYNSSMSRIKMLTAIDNWYEVPVEMFNIAVNGANHQKFIMKNPDFTI